MTTKTKTEADDVCRICKCKITITRYDDYPDDVTVPEMFDGLVEIGLGDTICGECKKLIDDCDKFIDDKSKTKTNTNTERVKL